MTSAVQSARNILTGLHEVMAARMSAQGKLNRVVNLIGEALSSEVCSIYLLREGVLELFATRGLNEQAVHVTRLALGEGLVGTIAANAETLNLDQAAAHPDFRYVPETGEERFHSFAGVPIIRNERALGVLAVQHVEPRAYQEVEIEAMQTVAMVLAELIVNAELIDEGVASIIPDTGPVRLSGLQLVMGMAAGTAIFHQPRVHIQQTVAEDTEVERHRVISAFAKMREQIENIAAQAEFGAGGEQHEVLEMYKMFAYDEGWIRRINEAIDAGLTAEAAIERVQQRTRMRMREIDDPLLAERMHDLEDLSNRLVRIVSGQMGTAAQFGLRHDAILIARNLGPAELLEYDKRRLKGVILEEGSLTAHVTIVARAMGIPVLGRVKQIRHHLREGDTVLLNVDNNIVNIRPNARMEEMFENRLAQRQKKRALYAKLRDVEPITRDGERIELMVNAGLRDDVSALAQTGADGIGLFRTEFQFLISATLPRREKQMRFYRDVLDAAGDKPVIFRTLDLGGDKALPYVQSDDRFHEENPALGWRALRLSLERDGFMKVQARALLEASAGRTLRVMFPLVSEPWEFTEAKALFHQQLDYLRRHKKKVPAQIRYGVMLEVPALAETLDILLPQIDFLSVGTNDLTQFLFAADRAHPKLAQRYDWLSPAILRFLARIARQVRATNVELGVCGEMGGRTLEAMTLLALGVQRLSITPASVGAVKSMICSLDLGAAREMIGPLLAHPPGDMRKTLAKWARDNKVDLG